MSSFIVTYHLRYTSDSGVITTYTYIGNGATVYFENNGFIYSEGTLSQLEEIAENLKNVKYYSGTIEYSGNPALDIGDYVRVVGGDANGELMLIGSDNWIFRGVQTLISPNTDSSTSSSGGYYSGPAGADGKDGKNGKDGFSPTIEVSESTDTSYILKITDKNGSFLTPNFLKNIIIDNFLSETSENAVQNKVITLKLKEFDNMFSEIKKLLEEIKALIGGDSDSKLYGLVCSDLVGLSEGVSGDLTIVESEG